MYNSSKIIITFLSSIQLWFRIVAAGWDPPNTTLFLRVSYTRNIRIRIAKESYRVKKYSLTQKNFLCELSQHEIHVRKYRWRVFLLNTKYRRRRGPSYHEYRWHMKYRWRCEHFQHEIQMRTGALITWNTDGDFSPLSMKYRWVMKTLRALLTWNTDDDISDIRSLNMKYRWCRTL